jgi:RNA polymerase sigma factor (sigma-70 family)
MTSDLDILQSVSRGDEKAFRLLLDRYAGFLRSFMFHLTKNKELSEELVQDIFLQVWETRESLERINDFKAYLYVISRNRAFKVVDKMLTERRRHDQWKKQDFSQPDPKVKEIHLSLIDEAITHLPPQQLKVWTMSRRDGKQYAEIATELNLSRETVKYYLKLATASITEYVTKRIDLLLFLIFFKK